MLMHSCSIMSNCNVTDCGPPGSSAYGNSQARILGWVAISSTMGPSPLRNRNCISCTGRWILYHAAKHLRAMMKRLQSIYHHVLCSVAQSCPTLWDPMDCSPPGSSVPGSSPGKNTGVGCHFLSQCTVIYIVYCIFRSNTFLNFLSKFDTRQHSNVLP